MSIDNAIDLLIRTACRENTDKYNQAIRILKESEETEEKREAELKAAEMAVSKATGIEKEKS